MACSSFRALLFWCREVLLVLFCQQQQQQRQQRQQPSSISHQFPQVFSSIRVSEVTLGIFWCDSVACSSFRALLFWCREVLLVLFCQHQQQQQRQQPSISHQFSSISSLRSSILVGFQKSRWALFRCDSGACSSFRALLFLQF